MAEPKKETVRIALPRRLKQRSTRRAVAPSGTRPESFCPREHQPFRRGDFHRRSIQRRHQSPSSRRQNRPVIPLHRASVQPPTSSASPVLQPLPKPAAPDPLSSATEPTSSENFDGASVQNGPKKETARITSLPKPAVNMTKTQPLIMRPTAIVPTSPVVVATSNAADAFDSIPRWLCWGLLGLSALIFFIQIWNYAVS